MELVPDPMDLLRQGPKVWNKWMLAQKGRTKLGSLHLDSQTVRTSTLEDYQFIDCDIGVLRFDSINLKKCKMHGCSIRLFEARAVVFVNVSLTESSIQELELEVVTLRQSEWGPNLRIGRASVDQVRIENCDMMGARIGALTVKSVVRINHTRMTLELADKSTIEEINIVGGELSVTSDFSKHQISTVHLENVGLDRCHLKLEVRTANILATTVRDSDMVFDGTLQGEAEGSAVIRSSLTGINLEHFRLGDTAFFESALPSLCIPDCGKRGRSIHDVLLPSVPKWVPKHPVRDIMGIGEDKRQALSVLQARQEIWDDIGRGGLSGKLVLAWAVLSGFGRSLVRLILTTVAVIAIGTGLLMIPQFQVPTVVTCSGIAVNATAINATRTSNCVQQLVRHLEPSEASLAAISLAFSITSQIVPVDGIGSLLYVVVGVLGILDLALLLSVIVYAVTRVSRD